MGKGKTLILGLLCGCFMVGCSNTTKEKQLAATILQDSTPVSYTHLTLPTIA